jgi:hypothetical protein
MKEVVFFFVPPRFNNPFSVCLPVETVSGFCAEHRAFQCEYVAALPSGRNRDRRRRRPSFAAFKTVYAASGAIHEVVRLYIMKMLF